MRTTWPKNENILNWDPENMEKYWELCALYDQYPQMGSLACESDSQQAFARAAKKPVVKRN